MPGSFGYTAYPLLEVMNANLSVICSNTNGSKCYIEVNKNGYIFKSDNLDDLIEKIMMITADQNKLKNMGERSAQIVRDKHNKNMFYEAFEKLIQQ